MFLLDIFLPGGINLVVPDLSGLKSLIETALWFFPSELATIFFATLTAYFAFIFFYPIMSWILKKIPFLHIS